MHKIRIGNSNEQEIKLPGSNYTSFFLLAEYPILVSLKMYKKTKQYVCYWSNIDTVDICYFTILCQLKTGLEELRKLFI